MFSLPPLGTFRFSSDTFLFDTTEIRYTTEQKEEVNGEKTVKTYSWVESMNGTRMASLRVLGGEGWPSVFKRNFDSYLEKGSYKHARRIASHYFQGAEREAALKKILELELKAKDFPGAVRTGSHIGTLDSVKKIATAIKNGKPDEATLLEVEAQADLSFSYTSSFRLTILEALLSLFQSMGLTSQAGRIKQRIKNVEDQKTFNKRMMRAGAVTLGTYSGVVASAIGASLPASVALGSAVAITTLNPKLLRAENMLGVAAGIAAVGAGLSVPAAAGVGVYTAFMTRLPLIQDTAKCTARAVAAIGNGTVDAAIWTADTVLNGVAVPLIKGVGTTFISLGSGILDGAVAVVKGIDRAMDYIAK